MTYTPYIAIFVLDDSLDDLEIISQEFEQNNIANFILFTDEKDFIKALDEKTFSILIIDHKLKDTNTGLAVMEEAIIKNKQLFIIILTGLDWPELLVKYMNAGANRAVIKGRAAYLNKLIQFVREGITYFERLFLILKMAE